MYYSRTGNTRTIGEELAAAQGAVSKSLPKSRIGRVDSGICEVDWMRAGKHPCCSPLQQEPSAYERLVVGTPIWSHGQLSVRPS